MEKSQKLKRNPKKTSLHEVNILQEEMILVPVGAEKNSRNAMEVKNRLPDSSFLSVFLKKSLCQNKYKQLGL